MPSAVSGRQVQLVRQSLGVGVLITPFNNPLPGIAAKVFPALLCGNTVVVKSHDATPYLAVWFGQILAQAGLPTGVYNVVQGMGSELGQRLLTDPRVAFISFTGSVSTARAILKSAAQRLTKVMVEAGGKNPLVICDDADLDRAAAAAVASGFVDAGQRCASGSRVIVMAKVYDQFKKRFLQRVSKIKVGTADDCDFGAIISEQRLKTILATTAGAVQRGARLAAGGARLRRAGFFMAPIVLENVKTTDPVFQEEIFGPVVLLHKVKSFSEAVRIANQSDFKLTGAVHTKSLARAQEFIRQYQAGVVRVNGPTHGSEPHTPFGGLGLSGNGWKETGRQALDFYSDLKQISIEYGAASN